MASQAQPQKSSIPLLLLLLLLLVVGILALPSLKVSISPTTQSDVDGQCQAAGQNFDFSQVEVCPDCKRDMRLWQRTLRQKAQVNNLFLSIWDIPRGKWVDPADFPAGTGIPVAVNDLRKVRIDFVA